MKLFDWYFEIKENLNKTVFPVTNLSLGTKEKVSKSITQVKRTEKRYVNIFNEKPEEAVSLELYCVEEGVKNISSNYLVCMALLKSRHSNNSFAMLTFDFSILDSVDIKAYMDITKKYISWNKEIIFECEKVDSPISYTINLNSLEI